MADEAAAVGPVFVFRSRCNQFHEGTAHAMRAPHQQEARKAGDEWVTRAGVVPQRILCQLRM